MSIHPVKGMRTFTRRSHVVDNDGGGTAPNIGSACMPGLPRE